MTDTTATTTTEPTGAQLVATYNALVEQASAVGLEGYRPVVRFTDRITADKRIAALESSIRARENGEIAEAPPVQGHMDPIGRLHRVPHTEPLVKFIDPRETGGCKTATIIECHEPKCVALGRCVKKEKRVKKTKEAKALKVSKAPKKDTMKKEHKIVAGLREAISHAKGVNGHGSKTAEVGRLLRRKNGCTTADILEATGWKAVSVPAMAKHLDLRLRKEKEQGSVTRYFGE
jgi:hypothetical protein